MIQINYNDIIKICEENAGALQLNDLDSILANTPAQLRSQMVQFFYADLGVGETVFSLIHTCPDRVFEDLDCLPRKIVLDKATKIGDSAFKNSNACLVQVTSNATELGDAAFENCKNLKWARFDNSSFKRFGRSSFCDCPNLTDVVAPDTLTNINLNDFKNSGTTVPAGKVFKVHIPGSTNFTYQYSTVQQSADINSEENKWYMAHLNKKPNAASTNP